MRCRPVAARTNQWFVLEIGFAANFFMMKCRPVAAERKGMYKAGLVLEGGGMKGIYTAGVLDFFWIRGLNFQAATGYPQEPAICAATCQSRGDGHMISAWII